MVSSLYNFFMRNHMGVISNKKQETTRIVVTNRFNILPALPGWHHRWGQSLVEFALILPILLLLVMGTFDLGRLFYIKIALESSAREGAYYLSYHPTDVINCSAGVCQPGPSTTQAIQAEADNLGVQVNLSGISITGCCTVGSPVTLTITQPVNLYILKFFSGPVTLSSRVRMMVQ